MRSCRSSASSCRHQYRIGLDLQDLQDQVDHSVGIILAQVSFEIHDREQIIILVAIGPGILLDPGTGERCGRHAGAIERLARRALRQVVGLPGLAVGKSCNTRHQGVLGIDMHAAEQPAQPVIMRGLVLDARDHRLAMRIEQRQQELVVELHHGRLVGLGLEHLQHEIERLLRPAVRQMIEIEFQGPDAADLVAPADALKRAPHRRQFADRHRVQERLGVVRRAQLWRGRKGLEQSSVVRQRHSSHSNPCR